MKRIYWISAIAVTVFALTIIIATHADEFRTWTVEMEAELVKISEDGKAVTLRRKDGREIDVALDKLSSADKSYVTKQTKPTSVPAPKPEQPSFNLEEELKKNGLDNLYDFAYYGNAELKIKSQKGHGDGESVVLFIPLANVKGHAAQGGGR